MAAYRWIVADEAVRILDVLTRRQRQVLFRHFDHLAAFPDQATEDVVRYGRKVPVQIKTFGLWRITWWIDGPVREVHILDIEKVRR